MITTIWSLIHVDISDFSSLQFFVEVSRLFAIVLSSCNDSASNIAFECIYSLNGITVRRQVIGRLVGVNAPSWGFVFLGRPHPSTAGTFVQLSIHGVQFVFFKPTGVYHVRNWCGPICHAWELVLDVCHCDGHGFSFTEIAVVSSWMDMLFQFQSQPWVDLFSSLIIHFGSSSSEHHTYFPGFCTFSGG